MRLIGERSRNVARPELVEKYGYDTKFAMQAVRLGFQGREYLRYAELSLPMAKDELEYLKALRDGSYSLKLVLEVIHLLEEDLKEHITRCTYKANTEKVTEFLIKAHRNHWKK